MRKLQFIMLTVLVLLGGLCKAQSLNLSDLDGSNGFIINGIDAEDYSGYSVSSAGDVNGDGYADILIGAYEADPNGNSYAGESYVIFGKASGYTASLDLSDLDGSNGFIINGIDAWDYSGFSVSSAGDVNGDGYADIIIGAYLANPNGNYGAGESYVIFGKASGYTANLDLSDLNGSNGFIINGIDANDLSGYSVSSAGDVNGDGYADIIIGAYPAVQDGAGESYVVFGKASGYTASLDLSDLDGSNGFIINGIDANDRSGYSVSSVGDVNGDGYADIIIGAFEADPNGNNGAGESYVIFGKGSGYTASLDLSDLNGSNGFIINGIDTWDGSGRSVSSAGDVNGDGYADIIIGAYAADPNGNSLAGESYVIFGKASGYTASLDLSDLDGSNGFIINGIDAFDRSGYSVSSAGDVNGDGLADIIIGARFADPNGNDLAGESYVVFGKASGLTSSLDLSDLDGYNGFIINGIDQDDRSGYSVSSAGDVNGDGYSDIIIGARFADPNGNDLAGESYVIFGFSNPTSENNSFTLYEDTQYSFTNAEGSEDFPFDDVDGDQLVSVEITTLPSLGTIYLDGNNNNEIDNDEVLDALDEVEVANIAKLKYKPVVNNNGTPYTTFTFKVSDGKNYCEDSYTMTINVNPVNDAPENTTVSTITPVGTIRIGGTIGATVGVWNDNDDNNQNEVKRK